MIALVAGIAPQVVLLGAGHAGLKLDRCFRVYVSLFRSRVMSHSEVANRHDCDVFARPGRSQVQAT
jgi:hypothetical protein